jgi:hypothetical protein
MAEDKTVQQFIELRSQGKSFTRIAKELIQNLRTIEWEDFVDRTITTRQDRLKALAAQLTRLDAELAGRDLATIPTPRLQTMSEQLHRRLERECGNMQFSTDVHLSRDDETREAIQDWPA